MAFFEDRNAAYDLSLFEENTAPQGYFETAAPQRKRAVRQAEQRPERNSKQKIKKNPEQREKRNEKIIVIPTEELDRVARRKLNPFKIAATALLGGLVAFLLIVNISGRVALTELNQKIINANEQFERMQSVYTQTELSVNSKYSTTVVEEYAKNQLQMSRATDYQREFINLSKGDKAEIINTDEPNIFVKVTKAIQEIMS